MKNGETLTTLKEASISIDRASKSWAIFEMGHNLVHGFVKYTDEKEGLAAARAFVAERSSEEPAIVYPSIKRFSYR